jgi:heme exporter protein A
MLTLHGLTFHRGSNRLLDGFNLSLARGECLHLQGANGSGKTTLLRLVAGLIKPDAGRIEWDGAPIKAPDSAYRHDCLYLGHLNGLQESATVAENMAFYCALGQHSFDRAHLASVLKSQGLLRTIDQPVKTLSQGQKRRVTLLRLVFSKARLWLLDEPLVALDQAALERFTALLGTHLEQGGLVLMTSHQSLASPFVNRSLVLG